MVKPRADDAQDDGDHEPVPGVLGIRSIPPGLSGGVESAQNDPGGEQNAVPVNSIMRRKMNENRVKWWTHSNVPLLLPDQLIASSFPSAHATVHLEDAGVTQ